MMHVFCVPASAQKRTLPVGSAGKLGGRPARAGVLVGGEAAGTLDGVEVCAWAIPAPAHHKNARKNRRSDS